MVRKCMNKLFTNTLYINDFKEADFMERNWWDDRTMEDYSDDEINHPCYGCADFMDGECLSNGACGAKHEK